MILTKNLLFLQLLLAQRALCGDGGKGIAKLDENACKQGDLARCTLASKRVGKCGYGGR